MLNPELQLKSLTLFSNRSRTSHIFKDQNFESFEHPNRQFIPLQLECDTFRICSHGSNVRIWKTTRGDLGDLYECDALQESIST